MQASDSTNARMSANCRNTLMDRNKLWMKAHSVSVLVVVFESAASPRA